MLVLGQPAGWTHTDGRAGDLAPALSGRERCFYRHGNNASPEATGDRPATPAGAPIGEPLMTTIPARHLQPKVSLVVDDRIPDRCGFVETGHIAPCRNSRRATVATRAGGDCAVGRPTRWRPLSGGCVASGDDLRRGSAREEFADAFGLSAHGVEQEWGVELSDP